MRATGFWCDPSKAWWIPVKVRPPRKIAPDLEKPSVNPVGGLHKARYTTLARPLIRFHDPPILTGSRLFRLCFNPLEEQYQALRRVERDAAEDIAFNQELVALTERSARLIDQRKEIEVTL